MLKKKFEAGLTLIELLLATAFGVFIIASLLNIMSTSFNVDRTTQALLSLQDKGRLALATIKRDLQLVGYQGCSDSELVSVNSTVDGIAHFSLFNESLSGWEVSSSGWSGYSSLSTGLANASDAIATSDVVRIQRGSSIAIPLAENMSSASDDIKLSEKRVTFSNGDNVLLSDCESVDLFKVTNDPDYSESVITLEHSSSSGENSTNQLSKAYQSASAQLNFFTDVTYFVAPSGRRDLHGNMIQSLFRATGNGAREELVEGVDNIQIKYGETLASGNIRYSDADDTAIAWNNIDIVRISILTSNNPVLTTENTQSFVLAGQVMAPGGSDFNYLNDKRIRKSFTTSINIRNRDSF